MQKIIEKPFKSKFFKFILLNKIASIDVNAKDLPRVLTEKRL